MKKESSSYLDTSFYYLRKTEECNIVVKTFSRTVNDGFDDNVHSIHACTVRYDSHYP